MSDSKQILRQANDAMKKAIASAKQRRNDEDRKYIVANIGADLVRILTPLLGQIADNSKMTVEEVKEIIKGIKIESPIVNVSPQDVNITSPEINIPEIKIPKIELPVIKVPQTKVTVKAPDVKIPKDLEINGLIPLLNEIKGILQKKSVVKKSDEPTRTILVDPKTGKEYRTSTGVISGGGGGVVSTRPLVEVPAGYIQMTVSSTAIPFTSIPDKAGKVVISIEDATIRYRDDGTAPTSTVGMVAYPGTVVILNSKQALTKFKAIRTGASDAELNCLYYEINE